MKMIRTFCLLVLASGMALAQANPPSSSNVSDELKALREAIATQQKQIADQQKQLENLQKQLEAKSAVAQPQVVNAALTTNVPSTNTPVVQSDADKPKESPLSFRIGGADFTPGGFVDFENVFRSTNTGNNTATSFWAIPFSNTVNGHLTEYRSTGQYSRINLKTTTKFKGNDVTGYVEADFNGNDAANVFVTSNPHTMRVRVYWLDLKRGGWEFLGGQTWGLQTPNRVGVSPAPADLSVTLGEDAQTHVGVNYTRAAEFRAAYHFNKEFVWAVAAQNPQQYGGQGQEVIYPTQFNAQINGVVDNGATPGAPNVVPDFITKFAYDAGSGHHFHFELGGLTTSAKIAVIPSVAGATFVKHTSFGAGGFGAFNYEVFKNFRVLAQGMWGPGVGRYLIGMAPQFVVAPVAATAGGVCAKGGAGGCDVHISPVHSGDALVGAEAQLGKSQLGFYYGGFYAQRNFFPDLSAGPNSGGFTPFVGFGFPTNGTAGGSGTNNNRAVQEGTIDWTQTFWKNPQYGAVLLVTQASYVTRAPWFVPAGAPKNAHLGMGYVSLRYVLP